MAKRAGVFFEKIWDSHAIDVEDDGTCPIFLGHHLIHEISKPRVFGGLRAEMVVASPTSAR